MRRDQICKIEQGALYAVGDRVEIYITKPHRFGTIIEIREDPRVIEALVRMDDTNENDEWDLDQMLPLDPLKIGYVSTVKYPDGHVEKECRSNRKEAERLTFFKLLSLGASYPRNVDEAAKEMKISAEKANEFLASVCIFRDKLPSGSFKMRLIDIMRDRIGWHSVAQLITALKDKKYKNTKEGSMKKLKIFICIRDEDFWSGAMSFLAYTKKRALKLYKEYEHGHEPYKIKEVQIDNEKWFYDDVTR